MLIAELLPLDAFYNAYLNAASATPSPSNTWQKGARSAPAIPLAERRVHAS